MLLSPLRSLRALWRWTKAPANHPCPRLLNRYPSLMRLVAQGVRLRLIGESCLAGSRVLHALPSSALVGPWEGPWGWQAWIRRLWRQHPGSAWALVRRLQQQPQMAQRILTAPVPLPAPQVIVDTAEGVSQVACALLVWPPTQAYSDDVAARVRLLAGRDLSGEDPITVALLETAALELGAPLPSGRGMADSDLTTCCMLDRFAAAPHRESAARVRRWLMLHTDRRVREQAICLLGRQAYAGMVEKTPMETAPTAR